MNIQNQSDTQSTCFLTEEIDYTKQPQQQQILQKAQDMGMDIMKDSQYFYLAKQSLLSTIPKYWKPVQNSRGQHYYVNLMTRQAFSEHPGDIQYQKKFESLKKIQNPKKYKIFRLEQISSKLKKMVEEERRKLRLDDIQNIEQVSNEKYSEVNSNIDENLSIKKFEQNGEQYQINNIKQESYDERRKKLIQEIRKQEQNLIQMRLKLQLQKFESQLKNKLDSQNEITMIENVSILNTLKFEKQQQIYQRQDKILQKQRILKKKRLQRESIQRQKLLQQTKKQMDMHLSKELLAIQNNFNQFLVQEKLEMQKEYLRIQSCSKYLIRNYKKIFDKRVEIQLKRIELQQFKLHYKSFLEKKDTIRNRLQKQYQSQYGNVDNSNKENIPLAKNDNLQYYGIYENQKSKYLMRIQNQRLNKTQFIKSNQKLLDQLCSRIYDQDKNQIKISSILQKLKVLQNHIDQYLAKPQKVQQNFNYQFNIKNNNVLARSHFITTSKPRLSFRLYKKIL